jgi:hypothetical protein
VAGDDWERSLSRRPFKKLLALDEEYFNYNGRSTSYQHFLQRAPPASGSEHCESTADKPTGESTRFTSPSSFPGFGCWRILPVSGKAE